MVFFKLSVLVFATRLTSVAAFEVSRLSFTRAIAMDSTVMSRATSATERTDALFVTDKRPVVLYDGVCNLCNFWVNFCLDHDPSPGKLRFAALQSDVGRALLERTGRSADDISSIVLVTPYEAHIKADAVLTIGEIIQRRLPIARLAPVARWLVPTVVADAVYDIVADNRYNILGRRDSCRLSDDDSADRFIDSL